MRKVLLTGMALLGLTVAGTAWIHADAGDGIRTAPNKAGMAGMRDDDLGGRKVVLVGEVLDMDCYMNEGAHGKKHQSCAVMCLDKGAPVGLLTDDGTAYFLTANADKGKAKFYDRVRGWGGRRAQISGVVQDRAGAHCVRVDAAEPAK